MKRNQRISLHVIAWTLVVVGIVHCDVAFTMAQDGERKDRKVETLTTKDGVQLKISYYPSKNKSGKQVTPVVLLHDYQGSRHELDGFATWLQTPTNDFASLAVVAVDLRGHGESTVQMLRNGRERELQPARFKPVDFANMVRFDMEAVRKFLIEENNAERINLNKLTIVGTGMGASIAMVWTGEDWSAPPLQTGKQGQDVKAVALISPEWSYKGLSVQNALNHPLVRSKVSVFIGYGERNSNNRKDADRIFNVVEKFHPEFDRTDWQEKQEVFKVSRDTNQQGMKLLEKGPMSMGGDIRQFIKLRSVKQDFPHTKRTTLSGTP